MLVEWFEVPGELKIVFELHDVTLQVLAVHARSNDKRRQSSLVFRQPLVGAVTFRLAGKDASESVTIHLANAGVGIFARDPDDGEVGMAPGAILEFHPGEPTT